jgi:hypothetical protein
MNAKERGCKRKRMQKKEDVKERGCERKRM